MAKYLDFEDERYEKGYSPFELTSENIKSNIGKSICYVRKWSIDKHRGYFKVEFATIHSKRYSTLYINDMNDSIDIRDVVECGIKLD